MLGVDENRREVLDAVGLDQGQALEHLVEGSKMLARGDFKHRVPIEGEDELAQLGRVFNDTALRLQDLYESLQSSEDRLRRVINTIPAHV